MFSATVVGLLSRKKSPTFTVDITNPAFPQQLRYAVKLHSKQLHGSVVLVDALWWITVYFLGKPGCSCVKLRQAVKEAIACCAKPLSYQPPALECTDAILCSQLHSDGKVLPAHPADVTRDEDGILHANCTKQKDLVQELEESKTTAWFDDLGKVRLLNA